jgi:glycerol-3-phosphate acyltransferase PlsY
MDWIIICLAAGIGYLIGSISGAIIISRAVNKSDVRTHGSGNAGATNMLRSFGARSALLTVCIDLLKGFLACGLCGLLMHFLGGRFGYIEGVCVGGLFAVIGHNWPIYFGFKGGKGVLTAFAVMLMISPLAAASAFVVFLIVVLITRYVSLGSILAAVSLPGFVALYLFLFGDQVLSIRFFVSLILAVLIVARHHSNIGRLIKGNESKLSFKKKEATNDNTAAQ